MRRVVGILRGGPPNEGPGSGFVPGMCFVFSLLSQTIILGRVEMDAGGLADVVRSGSSESYGAETVG